MKKIAAKSKSVLEIAQNEIEIMRQLKNCPGVIRLEDAFCDEHKNIFLVLELAKTSLMALLQKRQRAFSEQDARDLFIQLTRIIFVLHRQNVVHRDIKFDNVYVVSTYVSFLFVSENLKF